MEHTPTAQQIIRAAISAAGGGVKVARAMRLGRSTPALWAHRGAIPAEHIKPLCDLGGNVVKSDQILEALARESAARKAA